MWWPPNIVIQPMPSDRGLVSSVTSAQRGGFSNSYSREGSRKRQQNPEQDNSPIGPPFEVVLDEVTRKYLPKQVRSYGD